MGNDQYVPKHFPPAWFESVLKSGDCNSRHIADLFDPKNGLYHDLQHESTTPAFSWITPDNCSDAHDAVCHGNNLSGGFSGPNTPKPPVNYTGGLYAADLFLEHIVPEIEASPAFRDGGLIDITFDEAFPPFTYTGDSFANSTIVQPNAATSIADDTAGETLFGRTVHSEPQGPNTPLATNSNGDQLYPGDGYNAFIDRDTAIPGLILGGGDPIGGSATGGARTDSASGGPGSATINDNAITLRDVGRSVSDTTDPGNPIPANCAVADVVDTPVTATASNEAGGFADAGSFTLTCNGVATAPTGAVTKINLGPRPPPRIPYSMPPTRRTVARQPQRPDQPLIKPGFGQHPVLQPLQLAADDGGSVRRQPCVARFRRSRPPRVRRPARSRAVRPRRVQQPTRRAARRPRLPTHPLRAQTRWRRNRLIGQRPRTSPREPGHQARSRAIRAGLAATLATAVLAVVAIIALGGASKGHPPRSRAASAARDGGPSIQSSSPTCEPQTDAGQDLG